VTDLGINRVGERAEHTVFRPLHPFTMVNMAVDRVATQRLWQIVGKYVTQGMAYAKDNPQSFNDPAFSLSADHLKLKAFERDGFNKLAGDMGQWSMNYTDLVRDALQNEKDGKPILSDDTLRSLYGLACSEISNESNLATMGTMWHTNSVLNFISPLYYMAHSPGATVGKPASEC